jgi:hypothetical protein
MSVAEDDTGHQHHKSYQLSPARSRNPQEYRDNHLINKQILNLARRQSPSTIGAHPNSSNNTPVVVEPISDDETPQNNGALPFLNSFSLSHVSPLFFLFIFIFTPLSTIPPKSGFGSICPTGNDDVYQEDLRR